MDYSTTHRIDPDETPVEVVVQAVAAAEAVDATDLPPIHEVVDGDALNQLLDGERDSVEVQFTYHGYKVETVPGEVRLEPVD